MRRDRYSTSSRCASRALALALLSLVPLARSARAQRVQAAGVHLPTTAACDYQNCALTIAPRWNGLAVVAGTSGRTVANLQFLVPHDITSALAAGRGGATIGADSVAVYAHRAVQLRRAGAALTDAGILLGGAAAIYAIRNDGNARRTTALAAGGGALLSLSIPLQFAADGALSRAVWWHNLRYAR